ncbi:MAG: efflux RND transporter periplasmic adaptor subunit [Gammaproteobacteria bacterium]|nr:efflux RND transporter periplasmic adaptor subunit [Gammaproteobacteria bacterium]
MRFFVLSVLLVTSLSFADDAALPIETATLRTVTAEQIFDGTLEAVNRSTVSAQTGGRIIELPFDVNDYVEKGAVIVRFRDTEQRARFDAAKSNLNEAEVRYAEADKEFKRISDVQKKGLLSVAALDTARANLDAARAKRDAAQANLKQAEEALEQTVIRAPYAGIVVERHVELGELATVGKPLMTGLSLEHLRAVVDVPQTFIDKVRAQQAAAVILPDGQRVAVENLRIFPNADPATHTFRVRAQLSVGEHGVYPGMLVKVAFAVGEKQELTVPADAVVRRSEVTAVYVRDESGDLSLRAIRAGHPTADNRIAVLSGLQPGDQVVIDPINAGIQLKQKVAE